MILVSSDPLELLDHPEILDPQAFADPRVVSHFNKFTRSLSYTNFGYGKKVEFSKLVLVKLCTEYLADYYANSFTYACNNLLKNRVSESSVMQGLGVIYIFGCVLSYNHQLAKSMYYYHRDRYNKC